MLASKGDKRQVPLKKRRSRLETKYDILKAIQREAEARPTHVMYRANVSWTVMQDFLGELESKMLVAAVSSSGHKKYTLTEKGIECLKTMVAAKSLLGENESD